MKIKWLGHSCFLVTLNDGTTLVTDPYDASVGYPPLSVRADVILSSHDHFDHSCFDAVGGKPRIINAAGAYSHQSAKITGIPAFHDDAMGTKRGGNIIFAIEAEGMKIVHLGDLGHMPDTDEQKQALGGVDVMLIPIGGFFTIDTPAAVHLIDAFKPRCAIAMHFANRYCHFPISDEAEFVRLTGAARLPGEIAITPDAPKGCAVMDFGDVQRVGTSAQTG